MPSIDLFAVIGLVLVFLLLGLLVLVPTTQKSHKKKKRRTMVQEEAQEKDWQAVSTKLERHIYSLRKDMDELEKKNKTSERELLVAREKYKLLQEKQNQEKRWKSKEIEDVKKKSADNIKLKEDFKSVEQNLESEHSQRLRLEREAKEKQEELSTIHEEKRLLGVELAKTKAQSENYRKEISELREINEKLSKKHDENTWIAKSEYNKLQKQMKDKDRELDLLKEKLRRELL